MVACASVAAVVALASPAAAAVGSSTAVQATPSPATVGRLVQLTATVTCADDPSGGLGVTFSDGTDNIGTIDVDSAGHTTLNTAFTTTGTHEITAAYNGNTNCGASFTTLDVTVSDAPPPPPPPDNGGGCLLCDSLIGFHTGDIHNTLIIH
jgi:hypothetical protein